MELLVIQGKNKSSYCLNHFRLGLLLIAAQMTNKPQIIQLESGGAQTREGPSDSRTEPPAMPLHGPLLGRTAVRCKPPALQSQAIGSFVMHGAQEGMERETQALCCVLEQSFLSATHNLVCGLGGRLRPQKAKPLSSGDTDYPIEERGPCNGFCPEFWEVPYMKAVSPNRCLHFYQVWTIQSHLVYRPASM